MRIISGTLKGRIIHPGKNFRSRPTTGFARESLFNILENRLIWEETDALDLFSGTGSIGFELVSRGCRQVTAVEKDPVHARMITEIAAKWEVRNLAVFREDVFTFLRHHRKQYKLVFADPPFDLKNIGHLAEIILSAGLLIQGGMFVLEHPKEQRYEKEPGFQESRRYGHVYFSFFGCRPARSSDTE